MSSYIGTAIKYPHKVNEFGRIDLVSGFDLLKQSMVKVLETPVGSEWVSPEFGSYLNELIFEPNDEILASLLSYFIRDALRRWERRVRVLSVIQDTTNEVVTNKITVVIKATNEQYSFVYPFYRELKY